MLGEVGIIGFLCFMWLLIAILKYGFGIFNKMEDNWARGLTLGFLAGFIGLLVHSFSANTFIIVRIMEPFWFLTGLVIALSQMREQSLIAHSPEDFRACIPFCIPLSSTYLIRCVGSLLSLQAEKNR